MLWVTHDIYTTRTQIYVRSSGRVKHCNKYTTLSGTNTDRQTRTETVTGQIMGMPRKKYSDGSEEDWCECCVSQPAPALSCNSKQFMAPESSLIKIRNVF